MFYAAKGATTDLEDDDFEIEFDFDFLGQLKNGNENYKVPECYNLWLLSQSKQHESLLGHPIISSFLNIKWKKLRVYYFIDVFLQFKAKNIDLSCNFRRRNFNMIFLTLIF